MAVKMIPIHAARRRGGALPPMDKPERFVVEEIHHGRREDHTQKKFTPKAMNLSLMTTSRWKSSATELQRNVGGRIRRRSPSTLHLNNSNVKRKASSRGRTK
ncbi:MAG TPA: hypothetical protein VE344_11200 [Methylomirabilota bacterium]|nr:hypothetical protein [Methylomirabilota bacterium]